MKKPEMKNEVVVNLCPNPEALSIHIATPRALEWIRKESKKYTSDGTHEMRMETQATPCWTVLTVSPCFDIKDVKKYLENPQFEK